MVSRHRRIETQEAKARRSERQHWAEPGGSHDRMVAFLSRALPMGVGVLAALMVITPLSPRGEVSFLLDRNKVAVINERLRVDNALYRGADNKNRPFSLTAGEAVQREMPDDLHVRREEKLAVDKIWRRMGGGARVREQPVMDLSSPAARKRRQRRSPCKSSAGSDDAGRGKPPTSRPSCHKASCHHSGAAGRAQMFPASAIAVGHE